MAGRDGRSCRSADTCSSRRLDSSCIAGTYRHRSRRDCLGTGAHERGCGPNSPEETESFHKSSFRLGSAEADYATLRYRPSERRHREFRACRAHRERGRRSLCREPGKTAGRIQGKRRARVFRECAADEFAETIRDHRGGRINDHLSVQRGHVGHYGGWSSEHIQRYKHMQFPAAAAVSGWKQ
jgi:hypothetical protein